MPGGGNGLVENVITLGTSIDEAGVNKLFGILDTNKLKAAALTTAITGAITATYKFVESVAKQEMQLQKLSKEQSKSIEQVRAEQTALEAMGKTLQEIRKDESLKSIYDDLVAFNKELEMPDMENAIRHVNKLQAEFFKLKSAVSTLIESIGARVLINLEMPLDRIGGKTRSLAEFIRDNLTPIATKLSRFVTAFAKGVIGIAETIGKIGSLLGKLPNSVKAIAGAISGVLLLLKTGPLGAIVALLTWIGDTIHDYEVYQWNNAHPEYVAENGEIPVAYKNLWEWLDNTQESERDWSEMLSGIGESLGKGVAESLNNFFEELANAFSDEEGVESSLSGAKDVIEGVIVGIFNFIMDLLANIDYSKVGESVGNVAVWILDILSKAIENLVGMLDNMVGQIDEATGQSKNPILDLIVGLFTSLGKGFEKLDLTDVLADVGTIVKKLLSIIGNAIKGIVELEPELFGTGENQGGSFILTFVKSIIDGIGAMLGSLSASDLAGELNNIVGNLLKLLTGLIDDGLDLLLGSNEEDGSHKDGLIDYALAFVKDLVDYIAEAASKLDLGQVGAAVGKALSTILTKAGEWMKTLGPQLLSMIPGLLEALTSVGSAILDALVQALKGLLEVNPETGKTGISSFVDDIFTFIKDTIKQLADDLTSGKIDLSGSLQTLGEGIGQALMGFILAGLNLMGSIAENAWQALADGELLESLFKIGLEIKKGIWSGIAGLWEGLKDGAADAIDYVSALMEVFLYRAERWLHDSALGQALEKAGVITEHTGYGTELVMDENGAVMTLADALAQGWNVKQVAEGRNRARSSDAVMGFQKEMHYDSTDSYEIWGDPGNVIRALLNNAKTEEERAELLSAYLSYRNSGNIEDLANSPYVNRQLLTENMGLQLSGLFGTETDQSSVALSALKYLMMAKDNEIPETDAQYKEVSDFFNKYLYMNGFTTAELRQGFLDYAFNNEAIVGRANSMEGGTLADLYNTVIQGANGALGGVDIDLNTVPDMVDLSTSISILQSAASHNPIILPVHPTIGGSSQWSNIEGIGSLVSPNEVLKNAGLDWGLEPDGHEAYGGRIGNRGVYEVGEDGPEYIIPITKKERALDLINQMLNEMGSSAVQRVMSGFGLGQSGTIGFSPSSMGATLQGMTMANTYNISAPVNINVDSHGADAKEIGTSIYDAAERHLMKTLRGVVA